MSGPKHHATPYVKERCKEIAAMEFEHFLAALEFAYVEGFSKGTEIKQSKLEYLKSKWLQQNAS